MKIALVVVLCVFPLGVSSSQCFQTISGDSCIYNVILGVNYQLKQVSCLPLPHSFIWASSLDPSTQLAYAMGGKGTTSRTLFTMNSTTGAIIHAPTVGYIYNTAYSLAADLRGNGRLYGVWNSAQWNTERPAEISPITGQPIQYFVPENWSPNGDTDCSFSVQFSTNIGTFDSLGANFITFASCSNHSYIIQINVDTGKVNYHAVDGPFGGSIQEYGVHPSTGRIFALVQNSNNAQVYDITNSPINNNLVISFTIQDTSMILSLYQLVFLDSAVCVYRPQDPRRAHPQAPDLTCLTLGSNNQFQGLAVFDAPNLAVFSQGYLPYVDHALPLSC